MAIFVQKIKVFLVENNTSKICPKFKTNRQKSNHFLIFFIQVKSYALTLVISLY